MATSSTGSIPHGTRNLAILPQKSSLTLEGCVALHYTCYAHDITELVARIATSFARAHLCVGLDVTRDFIAVTFLEDFSKHA